MSRRVKVWAAIEVLPTGEQPQGYGSMVSAAPLCEQTLAGDTPHVLGERLTVAANTKLVVYSRANDGAFDKLWLRIVGSGSLHLAIRTEDEAAPTTKRHWMQLPNLSCKDPVCLNSDDLLTIAAAADMNADDGTGFPSLWSNAGRVAGVVYSIAVFNPSADDAVTLERVLL